MLSKATQRYGWNGTHQRGCAARASHTDGLGTAIVTRLDVELHLLGLPKAAVAISLDAGLHEDKTIVLSRARITVGGVGTQQSAKANALV